MNTINWGIIGCGDVTEIKSGPAFNKVPNSALVAVMRRNSDKAADYAKRHNVPKWYKHVNELINDPDVNAIYIATPPAFHEAYTMAAIKTGKPVYVEKPMSLTYKTAQKMYLAAEEYKVKLVVAHYRRQWPLFKKLKELIDAGTIGNIQLVKLEYYKPALTAAELADEKIAWRVNPAISGGGLFHDLAPHQLDILYHLFGDARRIQGIATNQAGAYEAHDLVAGNMLFNNNIAFTGTWYFNAATPADYCEITGSRGNIRFSFFSNNIIELMVDGKTTVYTFDALQHVQQPMIEKTVSYFLGQATNPCSGYEASIIMRWMEIFVSGR
jgi:predicted dehydrogenase